MLHSGAMRVLLTAALATLLHAQSDKPSPESTETTALPLPSNIPAVENPASTDAPVPAANIAYASDGKYLYIQGGQKAGNLPNLEFFALDLMANWATTNPKWWSLNNTVDADASSISGVSGALDHKGRFTVVASNGALYTLQNKKFSRLNISNNVDGRFKSSGPVIAALPTTGKVYLMGDGTFVNLDPETKSPVEDQVPTMDTGHAVSWSARKGAMVGTFTTTDGQLGVREYKPGPSAEWVTLSTDSKVSSRTGHCFVSNLEGTKFYLFGGVSDNNKNVALGDVYTFDLGSSTWSYNGAGSPRSKMACAVGQDKSVAQEMLVVWGGYMDGGTTVVNSNFPMVFNPASNSLIENFNGAPVTETPPGSNKGSDSSNVAVIAGAVAGGVALILLVAGLCILRRRRRKSFSGKSRGFSSQKPGRKSGEGTMEMGGYTSIPSPFVPDESYYQQRPGGAHSSPGQSPMSSNPLASTDQTTPSYLSMPVSVPSTTPISFSAPPLKPRPQSYVAQTSAPTLIQSPFEPDVDLTTQRLAYSAPISAPIPAPAPQPASLPITLSSRPIQMEPYHDRQMGQSEITSGENLTVSARSTEPTTIDLIPITPSEAGEIEESHASRSNSLVSSQAAPSRTRSKPRAFDEPAMSRRDSTESLEYLDIA